MQKYDGRRFSHFPCTFFYKPNRILFFQSKRIWVTSINPLNPTWLTNNLQGRCSCHYIFFWIKIFSTSCIERIQPPFWQSLSHPNKFSWIDCSVYYSLSIQLSRVLPKSYISSCVKKFILLWHTQLIVCIWLLSAAFWKIIRALKSHMTCYNLNLNSWQN